MAAAPALAAGEERGEPSPEEFVYGEEDFVLQPAGWDDPDSAPSRFDRALLAGWSDRMERGLFRYRLGPMPTRVLPGPVRLVAQLNEQRSAERRPPQPVRSLRDPFDPDAFNFTRLRPAELLLRLRRAGGPGPPPDPLLVAINASPLERGHVLLLPEPARRLPQALTASALRGALEVALLSAHPGFHVGFNGLGGGASVNHLHLHGLYLGRPLPLEAAPAEPLGPRLGLLRAGPATAFLFFAAGPAALEPVSRDVCRAVEHLGGAGLACNVLATRGDPPAGPGSSSDRGLRVLLWARPPRFGPKAGEPFPVAVCELAGFLPLPAPPLYQHITEAQALSAIRQHLLPEPELLRLGGQLARLLES
ncbi:GDP-D-glucose phosphorylase 1 [Chiroxiphia lanceolata]|uniref:GDP-D-glucose phosphorylase 1 n=1 Tax=Chiroxiphia lanceolata TaxID=296741 RepID=UPI0013CF00A0|nr:GDP-D-glucose phosphorylase 1 [Chiroxiphia lanceolata]